MPTCLSRGGATSMVLALNLPDAAKAPGSDDERSRHLASVALGVLLPGTAAEHRHLRLLLI